MHRPGLATAIAALLVLAPAASGATPLPRLSRDRTPANVASTYGSGNFGSWGVDGFGRDLAG